MGACSAVGAPSTERAPLHISWALLRNARTLYGCASQVGQSGDQKGSSGEDAAGMAAERDIEVTSALAGSAAEVRQGLLRHIEDLGALACHVLHEHSTNLSLAEGCALLLSAVCFLTWPCMLSMMSWC